MIKALKVVTALALLASVTACTIIPPQVAYTGPAVVVGVRPAPYYGPYYGHERWEHRW